MKHLYRETACLPVPCPVLKNLKSEVFKIVNLSITAKNIILQAAQNTPLQGTPTPADELLYYQARELYDLHAKGMITAAIGAERKNKIIAAYIINSNREQNILEATCKLQNSTNQSRLPVATMPKIEQSKTPIDFTTKSIT